MIFFENVFGIALVEGILMVYNIVRINIGLNNC